MISPDTLMVVSPFSIVIIAQLQTSDYNVRESDETVALVITANGTSEYPYNVSVIAMDISTGECG